MGPSVKSVSYEGFNRKMNTEIQKYRNAKIQKCRDAGRQKDKKKTRTIQIIFRDHKNHENNQNHHLTRTFSVWTVSHTTNYKLGKDQLICIYQGRPVRRK